MQRAVGRGDPDFPLRVGVDGDGAAGRRHALRRYIDVDLLGLGIDAAEAAAAGIGIEPEDALVIAYDAVGVRCEAALRSDLVELGLTGLGVDPADSGLVVRRVHR